MGRIRIRKTITLPNGVKININKDSISYTVSGAGGNYTYNPKKETATTTVKIADGISYVDKQKIKTKTEKNNKFTTPNSKSNDMDFQMPKFENK